jgi:signal transduction histidine kinase
MILVVVIGFVLLGVGKAEERLPRLLGVKDSSERVLPEFQARGMVRADVRADSLQRVLQQVHHDTDRVMVMCALALEYYRTAPERTKEYAFSALALAKSTGFARGTARATIAVAVYYWQQNLYDRALRYALSAVEQCERLGMTNDLARALTTAGSVHIRTRQYSQALQYYEQALQIAESLQDRDQIATLLSNRAQVYRLKDQQYDRAIAELRRAIAIFEAVGNLRRVAMNYNIIGTMYDEKKEPLTALDYHRRSATMARQLQDNLALTEALIDCAVSLNALQRYQESLPYAREAVELVYRLNARHIAIYATKTLSEIYEHLGQYREAYQWRVAAFELQDTVFSKERSQAIAEMQARFDLDRKEQQLQRQQQELERQVWIRNVVIYGAVVLGLVALWMTMLVRAKAKAERALLAEQHRVKAQALALSEANAALERSNSQLVELNNEKNEMLGVAVHDLKNPLSAISLSAELLLRAAEHNSVRKEKVLEYADSIRSLASQMLDIITNLLDINRIEQGGFPITLQPVEVSLVQAVVELYQSRAAAKAIALVYQPGEGIEETDPQSHEEPQFLADYRALQHVIENLVSNAIKYSPHGKNVFVRVKSSVDAVRVEVQDEGPGISEEDMKKLFGKFARLSAQPTGGEHSTGLGLSIVKKLVEAMHGRVWCESELGKGATFVVELPLAE